MCSKIKKRQSFSIVFILFLVEEREAWRKARACEQASGAAVGLTKIGGALLLLLLLSLLYQIIIVLLFEEREVWRERPGSESADLIGLFCLRVVLGKLMQRRRIWMVLHQFVKLET